MFGEVVAYSLIDAFAFIVPDLIKYAKDSSKDQEEEVTVPGLVSCAGTAAKIERGKKKEKERELRKACKLNNEDYEIYISDRLYADITRMSKGSKAMKWAFETVALRSSKLFLYALYYLTDPSAKLLSFDEDDCTFINTISELAGAGRIYKTFGVYDINKFDSKFADINFDEGFLISVDEVMEKINDEENKKKIIAKLGMGLISNTSVPWLNGTVGGINGRVDEDGMIHPIFFTSEPLNDFTTKCQSENISPDKVVLFESKLTPFVNQNDFTYYSTDSDGAYILNICRSDAMGAVDSYIIDDGSILGGENVSVLGTFIRPDGIQDNIFISIDKNPDIAQRILNNKFYMLNQYEVMEAVKAFFNDSTIYHNIDFTNTYWYDNLNNDQLSILERRLSRLLPYVGGARLRFTAFSSVDSFSLCSDGEVKSVLRSSGATSSKILNGMTIVVTGNSANIYFAGKSDSVSLE